MLLNKMKPSNKDYFRDHEIFLLKSEKLCVYGLLVPQGAQ